jgi:hypothetical protein
VTNKTDLEGSSRRKWAEICETKSEARRASLERGAILPIDYYFSFLVTIEVEIRNYRMEYFLTIGSNGKLGENIFFHRE